MTTAVIGATGRVGSEIVRGVLARGDAVAALVRDPGKACRAFGEPDGLRIRPTRLDDPRDLTAALDGIRTVFLAMGSTGIEGVLKRIAMNAAAGISSIEQVTRLSVLNTSADSLGINQRAHYSIDQFASSTAVPYSTIRPAIFSASLLAAAPEVRASRTWTGLAGSGRMALIDHRDAAEAGLRVLTDPALWGAHHDLTGPVPLSWPEALELLSAELGEPVTYRVATERQFLEHLTGAGVPAGTAGLLITREWAILAGENDYTTGTIQQITGHPPRPVAEFLHEYPRNSPDARASPSPDHPRLDRGASRRARRLAKRRSFGRRSGFSFPERGRSMGVWLVWLILAVVLGVAEILTLTAVLGILSAAALITSIAAAVGIPVPIQLGVFAMASVVGLVLIRPVVRRHLERPSIHVFGPAAHAGKTARVVHEIHGDSGRVRIDGEDWTARTYDEALVIPVGTVVDVLEINGVIALVYPKE